MSLAPTLQLLRMLLADVPVAIRTADELMAWLNAAQARLSRRTRDTPVTAGDIEALIKEIRATSARIQDVGEAEGLGAPGGAPSFPPAAGAW